MEAMGVVVQAEVAMAVEWWVVEGKAAAVAAWEAVETVEEEMARAVLVVEVWAAAVKAAAALAEAVMVMVEAVVGATAAAAVV